MTCPRLRSAARDRAIRGAPLAVYLHLVYELDPVCFTPIKVASIAHTLHLKDVTCAWALRRLVTARYLERGPKSGRTGMYRLVWSAPTTTAAKAS